LNFKYSLFFFFLLFFKLAHISLVLILFSLTELMNLIFSFRESSLENSLIISLSVFYRIMGSFLLKRRPQMVEFFFLVDGLVLVYRIYYNLCKFLELEEDSEKSVLID
jgi:hypothetical protein